MENINGYEFEIEVTTPTNPVCPADEHTLASEEVRLVTAEFVDGRQPGLTEKLGLPPLTEKKSFGIVPETCKSCRLPEWFKEKRGYKLIFPTRRMCITQEGIEGNMPHVAAAAQAALDIISSASK